MYQLKPGFLPPYKAIINLDFERFSSTKIPISAWSHARISGTDSALKLQCSVQLHIPLLIQRLKSLMIKKKLAI